MKIAIFGIGALGMLFGSRLHAISHVTLIGNWPAQIEAVRRDGLWVTQMDGAGCHVADLRVTNRPEDAGVVDVVLVLVKSHQTRAAAEQAERILSPDGLAITLQNGVGNLEALIAQLGGERTSVGVTAQGAVLSSPGQLRHAGDGMTYLADSPHRRGLAAGIATDLRRAGLPTEIVDAQQAAGLIWGKLAVNAGINPLTALFEMANGALVDDPTLKRILIAAACETATVAAAQGIRLPYADPAAHVVAVAQITATNHSSMWQDIRRGAPTEIDAISGAVVAAGRRLGVSTPVNAQLYRLVSSKTTGQRLTHSQLIAALTAELDHA